MAAKARRIKPTQFPGPFSHPFTGPLAKPIETELHVPSVFGPSSEEAKQLNEKEASRCFHALFPKLDLLLDHYGIGREGNAAFIILSLKMALDFVPGFQIIERRRRGPGQPKKYTLIEQTRLVADVALYQRDKPTATDKEAIKNLRTSPRFKVRWGSWKGTNQTLHNRLIAARKPEINPFMRAKDHISKDEFERILITCFSVEASSQSTPQTSRK